MSPEVAEGVKSFASGGCGGCMVVLLGHPLDTAKVRLMTDSAGAYTGTRDCLVKSWKRYGLRKGLFAGMAVPMMTAVPVYAAYFWGFDEGKRIAMEYENNKSSSSASSLSFLGIVFAGTFSAMVGTAVVIPGDLIKVQLQVENAKPVGERRFLGPVACIRRILQQDGLLGMYRGSGITMLREVPATIAYYTMYEMVRPSIHHHVLLVAGGGGGGGGEEHVLGDAHHPLATALAGGMAGAIYTLVSTPADVVKSRLQTEPRARYPGGSLQVARELVLANGPAGLFRGLVPALLRNVPSNAACFWGVEACKRVLDEYL